MENLFNAAVAFAAKAHDGQVRKITHIPYILHPMEVAIIASTLTADEDTLIACILHDTVEDTDVSADEVEAQFGKRVRALVSSETEDKMNHLPREASWKLRKEQSIAVLQKTDDTSVKIMWLSDKLANMRSVYASWCQVGDKVFDNFHMKEKAQHAWYYRTILAALSEFAGTTAYAEYRHLCDTVFADIPESF